MSTDIVLPATVHGVVFHFLPAAPVLDTPDGSIGSAGENRFPLSRIML